MCFASAENHVKCEECKDENIFIGCNVTTRMLYKVTQRTEKLCNMHEYLNYSQNIALPSIKENSTDKMCFATVENHVECEEECWEENMDIRLQCYNKDIIQS